MREKAYENNRITFIIGMFAANFTLFAFKKDIKSLFYFLPMPKYFGLTQAFLVFNLLLGVTIYFYSLSFLGRNINLKTYKTLGNFFYIIAMSVPFLYPCYYIVFF